MRKPLLQMTSFWLSYLVIAIDDLYIYELLGYMRCLFFKAVTESFIFVWFFLFGWLVGFYFITTLLSRFNRLQNHLQLHNFDHDFDVRWKIFQELFFSYFRIKITFTLLHTGPPYIKQNGTKRLETD